MADFPSSPSNGDTHIIGNTIWVYNSGVDSWLIQDVNEYAVANLQNTPPANPDEGTLWYDSQTTGRLFIYINGAWIDASPGDNSDLVGGNDVTVTQANNQYTIDVDDVFLRKDGTNNGASDVVVNDADFIVRDNTDGTTNFIWRDHSANELKLGTANAVPTLRATLNMNSNNITNGGTITATNATFDAGTSTTVNVKCDDAGLAMVRANGDNQGTGALEVGQSNSYGGGISYNGDGSPAFVSGEGSDRITFYRLDAGNRYEVFSYAYNGNTVDFNGTVRSAGDLIAFYSDERLKTFEGPIGNALDIVDSLTGYYYTGNEVAGELGYDTESRQVGVSAQQVEAVLPEVVKPAPVNRNKDTDYKTVQYEKLVPVLIEAIKELRAEIETLKGK